MEVLTPFQQGIVVVSAVLAGFILSLIVGEGSILAVSLLLYVVGYNHPHIVIGTTAVVVALTAFANLLTHLACRHGSLASGADLCGAGSHGDRPLAHRSAKCFPARLCSPSSRS